jgi:hypothetical protein
MAQQDKDPPLDPTNEAIFSNERVSMTQFARSAQLVKRNLDLAQLSPVDRLAAVKAHMREENIKIHVPLKFD